MPNNLPVKQNIFHSRPSSDVMNNHVIPVSTSLIHDDTDVGDAAS